MPERNPPLFCLAPGLKLCLASGSPRRRELLTSLGIPFEILKPDCPEPQPMPGEDPCGYAVRMAALKARSVRRHGPVILAADTVVCVDAAILGKPANAAEALAMLERLNGREHLVCTAAHALLPNHEEAAFCGQSLVKFGLWPEQALAAYASSGEPLDKAGAYAIQGQGAFLVENLQGSFTNVVGLPLEALVQVFLEKGIISPAPAAAGLA